jgi:ABC-2 type transport system permease protein
VIGPLAFAAVLGEQSGVPADTLFGVWVHGSGYAVSLVVLGFAGYLGLPVIAGVVAGDMFSAEDRYGTWKTLLTRSRTRRDVFAAKALAATSVVAVLTLLAGLSSVAAGLLVSGSAPLVGLGGTVIPSGEALGLVVASWLLSIPPALAFASIAVLFSTATRNGIIGVLAPVLVALAMQLLALIGRGGIVHTLLLGSAFEDWHGLLAAPKFYAPLLISLGVCALWSAACLGASWAIVRRRDFAGPPVARRPGWAVALAAGGATAALLALLGAASDLGPVTVTNSRLEASFGRAFSSLTRLQQAELGRPVPAGTTLKQLVRCTRRSGKDEGPGDDWTCAVTAVGLQPGSSPLQLTPVDYDVSVKASGCYKADAPPSFVGQQSMRDAHGHDVVNPLFVIYGCFDTTTSARCPSGAVCAGGASRSGSAAGRALRGGAATPAGSRRVREGQKAAERKAGPKVIKEIEEDERRLLKEGRTPEAPAGATGGR